MMRLRYRCTYAVAAAANVKVCGGRDTRDEGEESAERVEDQREDGVDDERLLHRDESQVEESEHAEDCDEHVVVDDRGTALDCEHVSDESHAEEDPEELEASKTKTDDRHVGGVCDWWCRDAESESAV
jgi:hypothetical protein